MKAAPRSDPQALATAPADDTPEGLASLMTTTRSARITGPVRYGATGAMRRTIPLGPCLLEKLDARSIDIIWGAQGQRSAKLPLAEVEAARATGHLVVLD